MQITESREHDILIFKVNGRLDNQGSDIFREHLLSCIADGATRLVIDFSQTSYIASMGIRALFIPAQKLVCKGGKIVLSGLNRDVHAILTIGGVLDLFPAFGTVAEAIRLGHGVASSEATKRPSSDS